MAYAQLPLPALRERARILSVIENNRYTARLAQARRAARAGFAGLVPLSPGVPLPLGALSLCACSSTVAAAQGCFSVPSASMPAAPPPLLPPCAQVCAGDGSDRLRQVDLRPQAHQRAPAARSRHLHAAASVGGGGGGDARGGRDGRAPRRRPRWLLHRGRLIPRQRCPPPPPSTL